LSTDNLDEELILPKWLPTVPCLLKDPKQLANAFEKVDSALILGMSSTNNITSLLPIPDTPISNNYVANIMAPVSTPQISNTTSAWTESQRNFTTKASNKPYTPIRCIPYTPNIMPIQHEIAVFASPPESTPEPPMVNNSRPSAIVMLTFASDGQEAAKSLAATLRTPRNDDERCGVLILQEQQAKVNQDPMSFIEGCFRKVCT
jgi:hypothetical protein